MIRWWLLERGQPSAKDIKKAIKAAKKLPDDGDADHILSPFPLASIPVITGDDWNQAKEKQVKLSDLKGSTARLTRSNLIWHLQHPVQSRFTGPHNTHPQVVKTGGDLVIVDGHHRLAALKLLGLKSEQVWRLKEKDIG